MALNRKQMETAGFVTETENIRSQRGIAIGNELLKRKCFDAICDYLYHTYSRLARFMNVKRESLSYTIFWLPRGKNVMCKSN